MKAILTWLRKDFLVALVLGLYAWAFWASPAKAFSALKTAGATALSVSLIIMSVFSMLGLFGVLVDKQAIGRRLGRKANLKTLLAATAFGTVLIGPVYAVFPLLKALREHGARWSVIAAIITASAIKLPMVPLESRFLGWRFSATRMGLVVVSALLMGLLFDRIMPESVEDISEPEEQAVLDAA